MYVSAEVSNIRNDNVEFVTIDELSYSLNDMFEESWKFCYQGISWNWHKTW